ncbi:heme ABC transporter ATP-binding protein [Vibrio rumoiensis]|uniref:Heme ABC transporter ATP-binding protein n=1 Tax=Vibrio rumoiensis 1S-45 TaxID=1188252 RepID=A0A1E5E4I6_9VIBR|nr:heme ABC transporter ATP-binding protein [Vibrio rumoiensis]OEF27605.1 heme ABC transporter ATP-binding protein [Vibrio rumoiensis 1S-45]
MVPTTYSNENSVVSSPDNLRYDNINAITASHLNLKYGQKVILDNINIELKTGQVTALLGPNGAGKSSLLKILCGEQEADINSNQPPVIQYFGKPRTEWNKNVLAKHLGILPQHSTLSFPFLVKEVVELGGLPLTISNVGLKSISEQCMSDVGIQHIKDRMYPSLSGGEKQRVHLARVLTQLSQAKDHKIFMLDEPTSALDLSHQHNTLMLAREMARSGAAIVVVLHDLNLASQYSDRILLLNKGKIVADGSPWETLTSDIIENVYQQKTMITPHPNYDIPVVMPI